MTNKETIDIFNQHLSGGKNMIMLKARQLLLLQASDFVMTILSFLSFPCLKKSWFG